MFKAGRFVLRHSPGLPLIMGVVNATPDSFSDGGLAHSPKAGLLHAEMLLKQGAHILDVGGESTRPGSLSVTAEQEWQRIQPILKELVQWNIPVSVDTMKTEVMQRAVQLGVDILNDVNGFRDSGADALLSQSSVGGVVMHMQGQPITMQQQPYYSNLVDEVYNFLSQRVQALVDAGVESTRILVDPGFGFGKTFQHNTLLFQSLLRFKSLGAGVLVGVSRKSMIGEIIQQGEPQESMVGSVAAQQGAAVVRVHDVLPTVQAFKVLQWATLPNPEWPIVTSVQ